MNFEPTADQAAFADTLSRFVADRYDPLLRDRYADLLAGHDPLVWRELAGLGLGALTLPEEDGGLGGGAGDLAAAMQALGPGLLLDPWLQALVASRLIAALGSDAQKAQWLDAITTGETVVGLALGEAGLDHPLELLGRAHGAAAGHDDPGGGQIGPGGLDQLLV